MVGDKQSHIAAVNRVLTPRIGHIALGPSSNPYISDARMRALEAREGVKVTTWHGWQRDVRLEARLPYSRHAAITDTALEDSQIDLVDEAVASMAEALRREALADLITRVDHRAVLEVVRSWLASRDDGDSIGEWLALKLLERQRAIEAPR